MIQEYTESLSVAPLLVKMNKSFAIPVSSCIARDVHLCIMYNEFDNYVFNSGLFYEYW